MGMGVWRAFVNCCNEGVYGCLIATPDGHGGHGIVSHIETRAKDTWASGIQKVPGRVTPSGGVLICSTNGKSLRL